MDKPFLSTVRSRQQQESPQTRRRHNDEFEQTLRPRQVEAESSRCMGCGTPFCRSRCPLGNDIPGFIQDLREGEWERAYDRLRETNPFPEFTGRICPAPCENACVLGLVRDPVAIESLERAISDRAREGGWAKKWRAKQGRRNTLQGKRIAIVGSGPAGLAAAEWLNGQGADVRVYERQGTPGGLLAYGIPNFKLDKSIVSQRIAELEEAGIKFLTGVEVGRDIAADDLLATHDRVLLAGGATQPRSLPFEHDAPGVWYADPYLTGQAQVDHSQVNGADVVVIGGGDTGADCVGTSIRLGAGNVTQIDIIAEPAQGAEFPRLASSTSAQHWPEPAPLQRQSTSHAEGCTRLWGQKALGLERDGDGRVTGLRLQAVEWRSDGNGRVTPQASGHEWVLPAQIVLVAIGYQGAQASLAEAFGAELDERSCVQTNNYLTSRPQLFAAGDIRIGASLVVTAIAEGRAAAQAIGKSFRTEDRQGSAAFSGDDESRKRWFGSTFL